MNKTPKTDESQLTLGVIERAMEAGLWYRPVDGFVWREDVRPLIRASEEAAAQQLLDGWLGVGVPVEETEYEDPSADPADQEDAEEDDPEPWLVPAGNRVERYAVLHRRSLLSHFERLAEFPSRDGIMRFATRYGWLGHARPVSAKGESVRLAEPLSLWRKEMLAFRDLRETWRAVHTLHDAHRFGNSTIQVATRLLRQRIRWGRKEVVSYRSRVEDGQARREADEEFAKVNDAYERGEVDRRAYSIATMRYSRRCAQAVLEVTWEPDGIDELRELTPGDFAEPARRYVFHGVNAYLRGHVSPTVLALNPPVIRYTPDSLLAAIYLHFAWELVGAGGTKQESECQHCHTRFLQGRQDQRYCGKNCRELAGYHRRKRA